MWRISPVGCSSGRAGRVVRSAVSAGSRSTPCAWSRTTAPSDSSMTRLRIWSTTPASWVAITTVVPVRLIRSSSFMMPDRRGRVEVSGRLVGDQDHRPVDERAGDRDPLLLATGQLVGHPVALAVEADQLQGLGDRAPDVAARLADHLQGERDVLRHGLVGEQPEVLEDGADLAAQPRHLPPGQPVDLLAGDVDPTLGAARLAQHEAQRGRLARSRTCRRGRRTRPSRCRSRRCRARSGCHRGRSW